MRLFALLLSFFIAHSSHADTTLTFKSYVKDSSNQLTYYIKNGVLRFSEQGTKRINLYNKAEQSFISIDQESGTISRIDKDIIAKRVEQLKAKRLKRLAEVEAQLHKRLQTMSDKEKEVAESLVNQLKYPEFYGLHTLIQTNRSNQTQKISNIDCQIYDVKRKTELLRQVCMAEAKALGMSADDYQTLRDFYRFNYLTQSQMMIAMGKTDFTHIDYHQENMPGIAIAIVTKSDKERQPNLLLESISLAKLDQSLFNSQKPKK